MAAESEKKIKADIGIELTLNPGNRIDQANLHYPDVRQYFNCNRLATNIERRVYTRTAQ